MDAGESSKQWSAGEQKVDSAAVDVGSTDDVDVGANVKPIARVHIEDVKADKDGNKTISI